MTLTDAQRDILRRMAEGETLLQSHNSGRWRCGEMPVNGSTANSLVKRGLIAWQPYKMGTFITFYELTDAGREAAKGE